jgi:hypothetical protein
MDGRVNRRRLITLLILFWGVGSLQGCSFLPFKECNILTFYKCTLESNDQIIETGRFRYNYQEPARKPLSNARVKSLRLGHPRTKVKQSKKNKVISSTRYYSANGNVCHTIDASGSEIACAVSGRWQASPSILVNSLSQ